MWDVTWSALAVLLWVAPWHVRVLSLFRLRWSERVDVGISVVLSERIAITPVRVPLPIGA